MEKKNNVQLSAHRKVTKGTEDFPSTKVSLYARDRFRVLDVVTKTKR